MHCASSSTLELRSDVVTEKKKPEKVIKIKQKGEDSLLNSFSPLLLLFRRLLFYLIFTATSPKRVKYFERRKPLAAFSDDGS